MRGSIRMAVGFLMAFGAVGGIENGSSLVLCVAVAAVGADHGGDYFRAAQQCRICSGGQDGLF